MALVFDDHWISNVIIVDRNSSPAGPSDEKASSDAYATTTTESEKPTSTDPRVDDAGGQEQSSDGTAKSS